MVVMDHPKGIQRLSGGTALVRVCNENILMPSDGEATGTAFWITASTYALTRCGQTIAVHCHARCKECMGSNFVALPEPNQVRSRIHAHVPQDKRWICRRESMYYFKLFPPLARWRRAGCPHKDPYVPINLMGLLDTGEMGHIDFFFLTAITSEFLRIRSMLTGQEALNLKAPATR